MLRLPQAKMLPLAMDEVGFVRQFVNVVVALVEKETKKVQLYGEAGSVELITRAEVFMNETCKPKNYSKLCKHSK